MNNIEILHHFVAADQRYSAIKSPLKVQSVIHRYYPIIPKPLPQLTKQIKDSSSVCSNVKAVSSILLKIVRLLVANVPVDHKVDV